MHETSANTAPPLGAPWRTIAMPDRGSVFPGRWPGQRRASSLSRVAAAILLILLLAGTGSVALYPLRWWESGRTPLAAPPVTGVATLEAAADTGFEFLWEFDGGSDRLLNAYGMAVDKDGNLWISDAGNDRIQIVAPDGTHLVTWGVSGAGDGEFEFKSKNQLYGLPYADIAFDDDGNIYVLDTGNARIQKFGPDRTFIRSWGSEGEGEGQFILPISVGVGSNGVVYVSDETRNDIQMFDQDGMYLGAFGGPGAADGEFSLASGLAFDRMGNLWVADWGNDRMQVFSPDGEFLAVWGESGLDDGQLYAPNDVAVDDQSRVFVADDMSHRLQAFTIDGHFLASIGGNGTDPGEFSYPVGTAVGEDGVVYVSDRQRVQAFQLTTHQNPLAP